MPSLIKNKVKTLRSKKKRSQSSREWLLRQLNDPYVQEAKRLGYRSRAAFKLLDIQKKFNLIKQGDKVIDLGAAPGGWTQVLINLVGKEGSVIALDIQPIEPIEGVTFIQGDFTDPTITEKLSILTQELDVIVSDMAPSASGTPHLDHIRLTVLLEEALLFCENTLKKGGNFIAKVLQGGADSSLMPNLKKKFEKVNHFKPKSSRSHSSEMYLVCRGFRPVNND